MPGVEICRTHVAGLSPSVSFGTPSICCKHTRVSATSCDSKHDHSMHHAQLTMVLGYSCLHSISSWALEAMHEVQGLVRHVSSHMH